MLVIRIMIIICLPLVLLLLFFNRKYQTHSFLFSAFLIATRRNYVGQHSDPRCIYVPPSSGKTFYAFRIAYARCGTKPDLNGQFYENTVRVQVFVVVAWLSDLFVFMSYLLPFYLHRFQIGVIFTANVYDQRVLFKYVNGLMQTHFTAK